MKFDEILAFIFGKKGICLLLITVIACLIFATACDISDFCSPDDVSEVCAGWDEGDCLMLIFCGCISPEYICNFASCACDNACDGVSSCLNSCNESRRNCIKGACDSCLGLCGTSQEEQTDCLLNCYSDACDCLLCIDTTETCPECGEKIRKGDAHESYGSRFCPECFAYLGPV